ncbi:hypothetical protein R1sor_000335 [Riccia sorocarpa]|uniref:Uncharacterized protein n=1 Tax=Riccia sorocarpa TaxID=122646 RepID=A0ABD3GTM3_9MARC
MACWLDIQEVDPMLVKEGWNMLASIGEVLNMAGVTKEGDGKFAHIRGCVLLDMSKPLSTVLRAILNGQAAAAKQAKGKSQAQDGEQGKFIPVPAKRGGAGKPTQEAKGTGQSSNPFAALADNQDLEDEDKGADQGEDMESADFSVEAEETGDKEEQQDIEVEQTNLADPEGDTQNPVLDLNLTAAVVPRIGSKGGSLPPQLKISKKDRKKLKKKEAKRRKQKADGIEQEGQGQAEDTHIGEADESDHYSDTDEEEGLGFWKTGDDPRAQVGEQQNPAAEGETEIGSARLKK